MNPYVLPRRNLNPLRLPIPPPVRGDEPGLTIAPSPTKDVHAATAPISGASGASGAMSACVSVRVRDEHRLDPRAVRALAHSGAHGVDARDSLLRRRDVSSGPEQDERERHEAREEREGGPSVEDRQRRADDDRAYRERHGEEGEHVIRFVRGGHASGDCMRRADVKAQILRKSRVLRRLEDARHAGAAQVMRKVRWC